MRRGSLLLGASAVAAVSIDPTAMEVHVKGDGVLRVDPVTHVAIFSMERHARKNAIGRQLLEDLRKAISVCHGGELDIDNDSTASKRLAVRCLVLESRVNGVFCAGADLKERGMMSVAEAREFVDTLRRTFVELSDLAIPTISAIEGKALGGGLELALSTDMRIASEAAALGFPETGLAIIPGAGGTVRAPRTIGVSRALELILTAEPVSASVARDMGLVNRMVPAGTATQAALQLAVRMARNGPLGVRAAKRSVREGSGLSRDAAMAKEQECYETVLASQDRLEGLAAFSEKREPVYKGL